MYAIEGSFGRKLFALKMETTAGNVKRMTSMGGGDRPPKVTEFHYTCFCVHKEILYRRDKRKRRRKRTYLTMREMMMGTNEALCHGDRSRANEHRRVHGRVDMHKAKRGEGYSKNEDDHNNSEEEPWYKKMESIVAFSCNIDKDDGWSVVHNL
jgi:hypothetical protein